MIQWPKKMMLSVPPTEAIPVNPDYALFAALIVKVSVKPGCLP